jgi:sugar/nucleoside kinase (ribokinase family)
LCCRSKAQHRQIEKEEIAAMPRFLCSWRIVIIGAMEYPPDYLVIGHVSKDLLPDGRARAGGTATYSAITAQRLGLQAAIVTSLAEEDEWLLEEARQVGVWVQAVPSDQTTTFRNVYYEAGRRTQILSEQASMIEWSDVPLDWRGAAIVHLGPVAQELPADIASQFPYGLLGITPQGWMRAWDDKGYVSHSAWPIPEALRSLPPNALLILSIEDVDYKEELLGNYVKLAPVVAVTQASGDAMLYGGQGRKKIGVPAVEAAMVDPTGAGDVFATALLVRYRETGDLEEAARFAHVTAAYAIEGWGTESIPVRERVLQRMGGKRET